MDLKEAIKSRQSIKKFSNKKADWRKIVQAIDSARYAPMAGNNFSCKFVLVSEQDKIEKIKDACQQEFIITDYIIVVASDHEKVERLYDDRGAGFASQQAGAAIQNILLTLTDRGLDACWVGYYVESQVKEAVGVPDSWVIEAVIPVGIRHKAYNHKKADKTDLDNLLYFEKWKNKKMRPEIEVSDVARGERPQG